MMASLISVQKDDLTSSLFHFDHFKESLEVDAGGSKNSRDHTSSNTIGCHSRPDKLPEPRQHNATARRRKTSAEFENSPSQRIRVVCCVHNKTMRNECQRFSGWFYCGQEAAGPQSYTRCLSESSSLCRCAVPVTCPPPLLLSSSHPLLSSLLLPWRLPRGDRHFHVMSSDRDADRS